MVKKTENTKNSKAAKKKGTSSPSKSGGSKSASSNSRGASAKSAQQRARSPRERQALKMQDQDASIEYDDDHKRGYGKEIAGVLCIAFGLALFVLAFAPPEQAFAGVFSDLLFLFFGVSSFIIPVIVIGYGITMFFSDDKIESRQRLCLGLVLLVLGVICLISVSVPGAAQDTSVLFSKDILMSYGGYVGSFFAWALLSALGFAIALIFCLVLIVVGLILIGVSIGGVFEALRRNISLPNFLKNKDDEDLYEDDDFEDPVMGASSDNVEYPLGTASSKTKFIGFNKSPEQIREAAERREFNEYRKDSLPKAYGKIERSKPVKATSTIEFKKSFEEKYPFANVMPDNLSSNAPAEAFNSTQTPTDDSGELSSIAADRLAYEKSMSGEYITANNRMGDTQLITADLSNDGDLNSPSGSTSIQSPIYASGYNDNAQDLEPVLVHDDFSGRFEEVMQAPQAPATPSASANTVLLGDECDSQLGNTKKSNGEQLTRALSANKPKIKYHLPRKSSLNKSLKKGAKQDQRSLAARAQLLANTVAEFGIQIGVAGWVAGPTVTLFKVDLPPGVRVNRIINLSDDIALALASPGVRIFAPIPGTNYVGIEVPNTVRENVLLGDVLASATGGPLEIAIGKDVEGTCIVSDLAKMPHLLIGGTTGSGKSVSINAMIMSILMRATPSEVRLIMIDPKRVEFTPYNGIPHLYVPVVTEAKEASSALSWGVAEMERRLKIFSKVGARNITQYNAKMDALAKEEALAASAAGVELQAEDTTLPSLPGNNGNTEKMPYIVIIIDELADLMMNVGKEVEFSISRIAQLARAAGIHLIVATQRPSTNVVTGLIKANITNRIAFNVASGIDSRVVLDTPGAENLIGLGDLLISKPELAKPVRVQGCYVSEEEIYDVVEQLKQQGEPEYHNEILQVKVTPFGDGASDSSSLDDASDPLLWEAAEIIVESQIGSTSHLQRRLKLGYSRASRIIDILESKGVVGPPNGSKPREVLIDLLELEDIKAMELND